MRAWSAAAVLAATSLVTVLTVLSIPVAAATSDIAISGSFTLPVFTILSSHTGGGNTVFTVNVTAWFNGSLSGNCTGIQHQSIHKGSNISRLSGSCTTTTGTANGAAGGWELSYAVNDVHNLKGAWSGSFVLHGLSGALVGLHGTGSISDVNETYIGVTHTS
jgi:hypothetical protein